MQLDVVALTASPSASSSPATSWTASSSTSAAAIFEPASLSSFASACVSGRATRRRPTSRPHFLTLLRTSPFRYLPRRRGRGWTWRLHSAAIAGPIGFRSRWTWRLQPAAALARGRGACVAGRCARSSCTRRTTWPGSRSSFRRALARRRRARRASSCHLDRAEGRAVAEDAARERRHDRADAADVLVVVLVPVSALAERAVVVLEVLLVVDADIIAQLRSLRLPCRAR